MYCSFCFCPFKIFSVTYTLPSSEYEALQDLYNSTNGQSWTWTHTSNAQNNTFGPIWFSNGTSPCDVPNWQGLICFCKSHAVSQNITCHITDIILPNYNLTGTIPNSFSNLTHLVYASFYLNNLQGTFPTSLLSLPVLALINIAYNYFTGTIPQNISNLQLLTSFNAVYNELSGPIPTSIGEVDGLLVLLLNDNSLSGSIPESLYTLRSLQQLFLNNNDLGGTISNAIYGLTTLRQLSLFGNHFSGTIPSNVTELLLLQNLNLQSNRLHGSIPNELNKMISLKTLSFAFNRLSGSIAYSVGLLNSSVTSVSLNNNHLTGSIPSSFCDMQFLTSLNVENNMLSGPIPNCFSGLKYVTVLVLSNNRFTGSVPGNMSSIYLTDLLLNHNQLTGTLPAVVWIVSGNLNYFEANSNQLTGTIPISLFAANPQLQEFSTQNNHITGSVPRGLGLLVGMTYLDLADNLLSKSFPPGVSQLSQLGVLLLSNNLFSGPINFFNSSTQRILTNVGLSNNHFTGTLPAEVFCIPTLQSFAAVSNCLKGSLPEDICLANQLTALALDGINTASSCRLLLFPSVPGLNTIYGLNYHITGTIPACLFNMSAIQSLHLSGNGIRGSLSSSLAVSPTMVNLSLSYNQLTGSVPRAVEAFPFLNLDLSYNRISGGLHAVNKNNYVPNNGSVKLQVNRLSGNIPKLFRYVADISMLNGNQFQCNLFRATLPLYDAEYSYYQCGSASFDQAAYAWLGMFLFVLVVIVVGAISIRCHKQIEQYPLAVEINKCAMTTMNWLKVVHSIGDTTLSTDNQLSDQPAARYTTRHPHMAVFVRYLHSLRVSFASVTLFVVCVLMPAYAGLSRTFGTYEYEYAWNVSTANLSGLTPAVVLFVLLIVFVVFFYSVFCLFLSQFNATSPLPSNGASGSNFKLHALCLLSVAFFNFSIVLLVNGAYVYVTTRYNQTIVGTVQFAVAVFKLLWNDYVIRNLAAYAHKFSLPKSIREKTDEERQRSRGSSVSGHMRSAMESRDVMFNTTTMLFNMIVTPCLATAAVSSDCFYSLVNPSDPVQSSYDYLSCQSFETGKGALSGNCTSIESVIVTTSYLPPFTYRYQCSSALVTTYAVVYVYMFVIAAFVQPAAMVLLAVLKPRLRAGSAISKAVNYFIPRLMKPYPSTVDGTHKLVYKDRFNLRIVTYLTIFVTFGAVFPPLGVIICVAVFSQTLFTQLLIGRFLTVLDGINHEHYLEALDVLERNTMHIVDLFRQSLYLLGPFAAVFYAIILFDTYGDAVGSRRAVVLPVLVVALLLGISLSFKFMARYLSVRSRYAFNVRVRRGTEVEMRETMKEGGGGGEGGGREGHQWITKKREKGNGVLEKVEGKGSEIIPQTGSMKVCVDDVNPLHSEVAGDVKGSDL